MQRALLAEAWIRPFAAVLVVLAAVVLVAAAGCEEKIYELDLHPQGDKIERRLTLTRDDKRDHSQKSLGQEDHAELARIAQFYQTQTPTLPRPKASFSGTFAGVLPQDIGGDGHYVRWESPLGRISLYVERFRGSDDIFSSLEARRKAVDSLVDLVVGWFESELRGDPDWPALRTFLDTQFRTDVQNFSLFAWSTNVRDIFESSNAQTEVGVRAAQYCVERKYASYEEAPALIREFQDTTRRNHPTALLARIRRLILSHAKDPSEAHGKRSLGFLADFKTMQTSWERYFTHSAYFKQHAAVDSSQVKQRPGHEAADQRDKHAAEEALKTALMQAFPLSYHFVSDDSRVRARLIAPRKPFWTNGTWNAKESRVEWSPLIAELPQPDREQFWDWPTLCFAAWDEPSAERQKPIFGSVGLTGSDLFVYCLWYQGLSGLEKKEWDAFLPTAKGQPASRVHAFRFSQEPPESQSYHSVATDGLSIITGVLYPEKRPTIKVEKDEQLQKAAKPSRGGR